MATADTAKMVAELGLKDKLSPGIDKAIGKVGTLEKRMSKLGGHVQRGLGNAARNTERAIVVGVTAAAAGLTYAVKQAVDAESAIAGIAKTVDGDISGVVEGLKAMSNQIPVSFGELAGIAELGGAMGIAKADLVAFTKQVAILGTTTNVSIEEAATALGQMKNIIGLTGDEFDNFAASLVDLGNKGNSTEAQILEIARRSGGAAKLIGVAKEQTLGWAAAAANLGLNEELAGTAVQRFFLLTQTAVTEGGAELKALAKVSGKTTKQFKKDFDKNATGALTSFLEGLGGMTKDARLKAIQNIFGKGTGLTRLIVGLADSMDKNLLPSLKTGTKAWKDATAAQEEADKRFATSASQFITLRNNIDNAAATIGANLLPVLNELAEEATTWLADPKTQAAIKTFGQDLAVGAREAVTWLKSLDWSGISGALKSAVGFGKGIVDAFTSAPPWVQQFLTAGFLANKFTGGAIGSVIGELGKATFDQFRGRGSTPANPVFVKDIAGGLPGGAGGGAAATGGMGAVSKVVSGAVIVGGLSLSLDSIQQLADANAAAAAQGLTPAEITAQRYYTADTATQQFIQKHLGRIPSKADFDSGTAKLNQAVNADTTAVENMRAGLTGQLAGLHGAHKDSATKQSNAIEKVRSGIEIAHHDSVDKQNNAIERLRGGIGADLGNVKRVVTSSGIASALAAKNAGIVSRSGGLAAASAVERKRWRINVPVTVNNSFTVRELRAANTNFQTRVMEFG